MKQVEIRDAEGFAVVQRRFPQKTKNHDEFLRHVEGITQIGGTGSMTNRYDELLQKNEELKGLLLQCVTVMNEQKHTIRRLEKEKEDLSEKLDGITAVLESQASSIEAMRYEMDRNSDRSVGTPTRTRVHLDTPIDPAPDEDEYGLDDSIRFTFDSQDGPSFRTGKDDRRVELKDLFRLPKLSDFEFGIKPGEGFYFGIRDN